MGSCLIIGNHDDTMPLLHRFRYRLHQALRVRTIIKRQSKTQAQTVDNHLNGMVLVSVELHALRYLTQLSVNTHIDKPFLPYLLKQLFVMSLAIIDQGSHHQDLMPGILTIDKFYYLIVGISDHLLARVIREGVSRTREQQPQVVVHLGDRADSGARVAVGGLLVDRDDGRQTCYLIHIRALDITYIPARIS